MDQANNYTQNRANPASSQLPYIFNPKPIESPSWTLFRVWDEEIHDMIELHIKNNEILLSNLYVSLIFYEKLKRHGLSVDYQKDFLLFQIDRVFELEQRVENIKKLMLSGTELKTADNRNPSKWYIRSCNTLADILSNYVKVNDILVVYGGSVHNSSKTLTLNLTINPEGFPICYIAVYRHGELEPILNEFNQIEDLHQNKDVHSILTRQHGYDMNVIHRITPIKFEMSADNRDVVQHNGHGGQESGDEPDSYRVKTNKTTTKRQQKPQVSSQSEEKSPEFFDGFELMLETQEQFITLPSQPLNRQPMEMDAQNISKQNRSNNSLDEIELLEDFMNGCDSDGESNESVVTVVERYPATVQMKQLGDLDCGRGFHTMTFNLRCKVNKIHTDQQDNIIMLRVSDGTKPSFHSKKLLPTLKQMDEANKLLSKLHVDILINNVDKLNTNGLEARSAEVLLIRVTIEEIQGGGGEVMLTMDGNKRSEIREIIGESTVESINTQKSAKSQGNSGRGCSSTPNKKSKSPSPKYKKK